MNYYAEEGSEKYYEMRKDRSSNFLQSRRAMHFKPHIKPTDTVLDFGCGTGGVLASITCAKKIGIEVNPPSIAEAKKRGLEIHPDFSSIKNESIDVIISNHALEHVQNPADHINAMHKALKPGGQVILVVPSENPSKHTWKTNDPDQHIFSWTPLSFGNLITQCGFTIEKSHRRPIGYSKFNQPLASINEPLFQASRHIVAALLGRYEVVCIARK